eukprot:COSAG04_NODE_2303_length_4361_cov_2.065228_4_plen_76_part_00
MHDSSGSTVNLLALSTTSGPRRRIAGTYRPRTPSAKTLEKAAQEQAQQVSPTVMHLGRTFQSHRLWPRRMMAGGE